MGRDTGGVRGMNVERGDNHVLAMDVVRPDTELLVVTDAGYGKRTPIEDYPVKGRGTMGVKTIGLTEKKGGLAGALIVREHQELVFISQNGMVQRTSVRGISKQGRPAQGVRLMNLREDDEVSAVALVMETATDTAADGRGTRRECCGEGDAALRGGARRCDGGAPVAGGGRVEAPSSTVTTAPTDVPATRSPPTSDLGSPAASASIVSTRERGWSTLSDKRFGTLEVPGR